MKLTATLIAVAAAGLLQSCAIGSSEYGCSGLPKGVKCMSARDVYDGRQQGGTDNKADQVTPHPYLARDRWPEAPWSNAPTIDAPAPVREPPRVMRIYVFPYEDAKGDLHMPGYVYSEIEPRRWYITDYAKGRAADGAGPVFPLDVRSQAPRGPGSAPPASATPVTNTASP